jgi:hypothetical protein
MCQIMEIAGPWVLTGCLETTRETRLATSEPLDTQFQTRITQLNTIPWLTGTTLTLVTPYLWIRIIIFIGTWIMSQDLYFS